MTATRGRLALLLASAFLCGLGAAQARRESLRVSVQLTPAGDGAHSSVAVRLWNIADHPISVWLPGGIWCRTAPGAISLEWRYEPVTYLGGKQIKLETDCGQLSPGDDGSALLARIAKQKRTWIVLLPGQYAEVQDSLYTAAVDGAPGEYKLQAVYTSPAFTRDDEHTLRENSIDTPKGQYRSEAVEFTVR